VTVHVARPDHERLEPQAAKAGRLQTTEAEVAEVTPPGMTPDA
jgi:hypothetical protein